MPFILGVTGFKRSGKSEIRKYLVRTYGFTVIPMAKPLKDMLQVGLGLTDEEVSGSLKEVPCEALGDQTPRHAMQTLGTEWGRMMIHDKLWVSRWKVNALEATSDVVADDVRFQNESDAIRDLGGKILRVTRPGSKATAHPSEQALEDLTVDCSIWNAGTLADLHRSVDRALRVLKLAR